MGVKRTILASAIALVTIGVFLWIQSASPIRENVGDAVPIAKQRASASHTLLSPPNDQTPSVLLPDDDPEFVRQLSESDPRVAAYWAAQLPVTPARLDAIKAAASAWANQDFPGAVE